MHDRTEPLAYTVRDTATLLGRSEAAIRAMLARGQLPARRQGGRVFILAEDLKAYLAALPTRKATPDKQSASTQPIGERTNAH
jgi:excisionase family DNA binding protein